MTDAASARDAERDLVVVDRGAFKELFDEMMYTRTKIAKDRIEIVNGALLALSYASEAALSAPAAPAADAGTGEAMTEIIAEAESKCAAWSIEWGQFLRSADIYAGTPTRASYIASVNDGDAYFGETADEALSTAMAYAFAMSRAKDVVTGEPE